MPRQTLYAYVDGADLEVVAAMLEARFTEFVASRQWVASGASVVNQRHGDETCTQPGDLALWDLGITLQLPDPGAEPPGWFADIGPSRSSLAHFTVSVVVITSLALPTARPASPMTCSPSRQIRPTWAGCEPLLELQMFSETPPNIGYHWSAAGDTGAHLHSG